MVALAQTREDAQHLLGVSAGHLSHLLVGTRGIGLDLANKVKAVYAELGYVIATEEWSRDATPAERLLIVETVDKIPRPSHSAEAVA